MDLDSYVGQSPSHIRFTFSNFDQIMEKALLHMDNGYKIPHLRGRGLVCKTYLPSYTAFRGFGGPQGLTIIESVLHEVAVKCGLPTHQVGPL